MITSAIIANLFLIMDWGQTRYIANHEQYTENNAILGKHPSTQSIDKYFMTTIALTNGIAYYIPDKYQNNWYITVGTLEGLTVIHNKSIGIGMRF